MQKKPRKSLLLLLNSSIIAFAIVAINNIDFIKEIINAMNTAILIVGGIIIGLRLMLKFISEKTGYDFNDKRFFRPPEPISEVALDSNNPIGDEI